MRLNVNDHEIININYFNYLFHTTYTAFLSASSLWLYVWRTLTMIGIVIAFWTNDDPTHNLQTAWDTKTDGAWENQCTIDSSTTAFNDTVFNGTNFDLTSIQGSNGSITDKSYVSSKMCITTGASNPAYPDAPTVYLMTILFLAQILIIPMIEIPNLMHIKWYYNKIKCHEEIQKSTDKQEIKNTIMDTLGDAASMHGANLSIAGFVVMWTFIANWGFVFLQVIVPIAYVGGILLLMMYWYCKCKVVKECPTPYNKCCCECCKDPIFTPCYKCCKTLCPSCKCCEDAENGMPSCYDLCTCCIPLDKNKDKAQEQLLEILQPRFKGFATGNNLLD